MPKVVFAAEKRAWNIVKINVVWVIIAIVGVALFVPIELIKG